MTQTQRQKEIEAILRTWRREMQELYNRNPNCDRCASCAFRPGTEANRTPETLLKVVKSLVYRRDFFCHMEDKLCSGFVAAIEEQMWEEAAHEVSLWA